VRVMDRINIKNLEVYANHGVFEHERINGQKFYVSASFEVDIRSKKSIDDISDTADYGKIADLIETMMKNEVNALIETCAEHLAEEILLFDERISSVVVEVSKPEAPLSQSFETVSAVAERRWHDAYIGLGSNIGDSKEILEHALERLGNMRGCRVEKVSAFIRTAPYGVEDQPDFLNGAARIKTFLSPLKLLKCLNMIEKEAGRERRIHWGPRTLDLDILFYDNLITEENDLCIPHADMKNRTFVLEPLSEIAPYKMHPVYRKRVFEMLEDLKAPKKEG
jgi:dihydroneopterin aldolase/2-amino-4-hydroxy-6-hydroxymethyldihydropteridine diphosphokinase